jgi:hypothetical protein
VPREIEVTPAQCPCCRAELGIDDNLDLHLIAPGLFNGRKIETVEATPEWKSNNYFFNQGGRPHRQDIAAPPQEEPFVAPAGATEEDPDPLTSARLKEAIAKDLNTRGIVNPTPNY